MPGKTRSNINLFKVQIFHTDRYNELKKKLINEVFETFEIKRSSSH